MLHHPQAWMTLGVMSALTITLRALPLLISRRFLETPRMSRLSQELPLCVMAVLVAHSVVGGAISAEMPWPKLLALGAVAVSYWYWRNGLLSVVIGLLAVALLAPR